MSDLQNYNIDLLDIWRFEKWAFNDKRTSLPKQVANELLEEMISTNILGTTPFIRKPDESHFDYKSQKVYWDQKFSEFRADFNNDNPFYGDIIYTSGAMYSFLESCPVGIENEEFDLFFTIKLRQYHSKLLLISSYLEFHLENNFSNDLAEFKKWLSILMRQYSGSILNRQVVETTNDWIALKEVGKTPRATRKRIPRTINGKYDTFLFDSNNEKLRLFTLELNNWSELVQGLVKGGFIIQGTKSGTLKSLFSNKEIIRPNRMVWMGSLKELCWFIKYFTEDKGLVEDPGNDLWVITVNSFVNKKGEDIHPDQLRGARGENMLRKAQLEKILDNMFD
ncbi:MAG: hypothetical protein QNK23_02050 [Crocinitomicaceae bacterium]|nr:hypothetical protein [Crocinitomicaceae bacterium]